MNRRWQKYYEEREKYTQSLEFRIQDLEKSYSDALRGGVTEELNRQMEQLVTASREKLEQVDDLRRKVAFRRVESLLFSFFAPFKFLFSATDIIIPLFHILVTCTCFFNFFVVSFNDIASVCFMFKFYVCNRLKMKQNSCAVS